MSEDTEPVQLIKFECYLINHGEELEAENLASLIGRDELWVAKTVNFEESPLFWNDDHELNQGGSTNEQFESYLGEDSKSVPEETIARLENEIARLKRQLKGK